MKQPKNLDASLLKQRFVKRLLDLAMAGVLLPILAVPMLLIAVLIILESGRPIFFLQERAGRNGRPFRIIKFRTMIRNAPQSGLGVHTEQDDPRITKVGRWLREWSLDELPQLFNVLKGDMSIIGPRPTLAHELQNYDQQQKARLTMRPGITGWAQVNGRNDIPWPRRIELDLWYIEHWSLLFDLKIILRTLPVVWRREGLYNTAMNEVSASGLDAGRADSEMSS